MNVLGVCRTRCQRDVSRGQRNMRRKLFDAVLIVECQCAVLLGFLLAANDGANFFSVLCFNELLISSVSK